MKLSNEFLKIKESFLKVKEDMSKISLKINENYDEFLREHKNLKETIENLSNQIKENIHKTRNHPIVLNPDESVSKKEYLDLKAQVRELKLTINTVLEEHSKFTSTINQIKDNKKNIGSLKEKLHSSELEIYLLKERLIEKDIEIKQMKNISSHMLNILTELSNLELEILNKKIT